MLSIVSTALLAEAKPPQPVAGPSHAQFARAMVAELTWGTLSTLSTRSNGTTPGDAFGNPYSYADVGGVPYFYASDLDASMTDLFNAAGANPRASMALSEASSMLPNGTATYTSCRIGTGLGDPENPPCARFVLTGVMSKVASGSTEETAAKAALFAKHPMFNHLPSDHGFYVAKMTVDGLWLISAYGGAAIVSPADYLAANASTPTPTPTTSQIEAVSTLVESAESAARSVLSSASAAAHAAWSAAKSATFATAKASLSAPYPWQHPQTARYMAHALTWGVLSTVSTRDAGTSVGDAFGNPYSFADVGGVPYFFASDLDASMTDLFNATGATPRASLALSEAALDSEHGFTWDQKCKIGTYLGDPENPPCARFVLTGTMSKVAVNSTEEATAKSALFAKHPSFAMYPPGHSFYVAKLAVEGLWLIDFFGGAAIIPPADYLAANL